MCLFFWQKCIRLGGIYKGFSFERLINVFAKRIQRFDCIWWSLCIVRLLEIFLIINCMFFSVTNQFPYPNIAFACVLVSKNAPKPMLGGIQAYFQPNYHNENRLTILHVRTKLKTSLQFSHEQENGSWVFFWKNWIGFFKKPLFDSQYISLGLGFFKQ